LEDKALSPPGVVTITSIVPAAAGPGDVAVICVGLSTVNKAVAAPKCTAVAPEKLVPVIITVVPPAVGPASGLILVTVGGAK
jgi:hypothetical protein